jgi:thiol:disulfide interchange protein DsbD
MRFLWLWIALLLCQTAAEAGPGFNPDAKVDLDLRPNDVIHWVGVSGEAYEDATLVVNLRLTTEQNFTLYREKLNVRPPQGFELKRELLPATRKLIDPISQEEVEVYAGGDFTFIYSGANNFTDGTVPIEVTYLGCTERICLFPFTETVKVPVILWKAKKSPLQTETISAAASRSGESLDRKLADKLSRGEFGIVLLILAVFLGGLLTNLTPCVAPMLPITIRILGKQNKHPLLNSSMYALGILITYTGLGIIAVLSGSAFGTLMSSAPLNLAFAVVMFALALTMIGFGNFSFIQNFGLRFGSGKPSMRNTFFMGIGAGFVAAPCTGPVLGALLAYAASHQGETLKTIALLTTYSLGFSLPYVFLGGAAAKASKIKVSARVQIGVKLVFASVMFGLSLYYLRVPFYGFVKELRPYWSSIGAYFGGVGAVLIAVSLIQDRFYSSKFLLVIPALLAGIGLFAGSQALTQADDSGGEAIIYLHTEAEALALAEKENKPIFIDNWAEWCEACKKMDVTTFKDPRVIEEITKNWIALKMDLTESNDTNDAYLAKYEISGLPTLMMLPKSGDLTKKDGIVGYVNAEGLLNRLAEFKGK